MSERRVAAKGRRLGSSRRKQLQEGSRESPAAAPSPGEEPPWASEIVQRVQQLLGDRGTEQAAVVTRSDVQKLHEEGLPCSREELELVFDGLDAAGTGRLGTEEFTAGLRQFLSSQKVAREHRRRKTASRRVQLVLPVPLEGVDSEERRHFAAFMEQLGTGDPSEEQEIWQLWVKLRQDEPQLLDNLEDFLAKMRHRIQEARSEKEALELTLNKRVAEHDKDVQQLCEVLEQQIQQEQLRLQQQSAARSQQQGEELQRVLDASEREVQRLVTAQLELERRCHSLQSSQQVTSTENRQLEESNRALEHHLQHLHQQLQHTQRRLRTVRAAVLREHTGEPGDRVVAELPIEVPMSPQLSPGKSEKFRSEMRIRLGSQSGESNAKSTHQVVWEVLPAETNLSGAPRKASSAEEDPFPEPLKEEGVSDQSSLLREMNDAIAALSKHLKEQALGAPPALADTPWDNAEPQTGPEAATARETTSGVLQETLPGHVHHELLEGDLQEGRGTAELRAPDVTQAGASTGAAGRCTAQEPGAEQGHGPEEAQGTLFLQGEGAGEKEMVQNVAEHLGESLEAGEQVLMEVEGAGWLQEKRARGKPHLPREAEEVKIRQRENLEAVLGPPEAGQEGRAVARCLAMDEQQPGRTLGGCVHAPGTALQEWAHPASGLPAKLQTELGEHLEPEPPSWGEAQVEAARGGGDPEVTVAPGPGVLDEERARTEVQHRGETTDSKVLEVLPARAERAGSEEEEVEEAEPREAEQQLQGECTRGGAGWRGSAGTLEPLAEAVPPTQGQGGVGTDVELMENQSSTSMELLAEVQADLQVWNEAGSPGTQQGRGVDPGVQLEKDKPEAGLGEEMGAAAVHSDGPFPAETPVGSPDLCGLFPVKSQALELVEADLQRCGGLSPEIPQGGKGKRAAQLQENEEEDGAQGQGEHGLPQERVPHSRGVTLDQGEGAGGDMQAQGEAESLDTAGDQSSGADVELTAEGDELNPAPAESTQADLQPLSQTDSRGTEQGGNVAPDVHPLGQEDKEELVEMEAEDCRMDSHLCVSASPETPQGGGHCAAVQPRDGAGGWGQGQGGRGLMQELVPHPSGVTIRQRRGTDASVQPVEEVEILATVEDQSSGADVELTAEGDELRLTQEGSTQADLQPLGEAGSSGTQQGGSVDAEVQPLDEVNKAELEEGEAEVAQAHLQLSEGLSSGVPQRGEIETNAQVEEKDGGEQGQGEGELPQEPVLDLQGSGVRQGEGAGGDMQAQGEAESLDTAEDQSSGADVELTAEGDELNPAPAESTQADLQPLGEAGSSGTQQGGSVDAEVQPLDQEDKEKFLEREAEDVQEDRTTHEGVSPGAPWGWEGERAVHLEEEDGAQGQGEHGLPREPVPHLQGSGVGHSAGAGEDVQAQGEAESLDTVAHQSSGANVELTAEGDELNPAPAESTQADLQPLSQTDSMGTEQGGNVAPDVHPLGQEDKEELVEMEAEDCRMDSHLCVSASPETPQGGGHCAAVQPRDGAGGWGQGQGGRGLMQELVPHPSGVTIRQRRGTDANVQPVEEVEILDTVEDQSSGADVELTAEGDELNPAPAESTQADLQPLGEAGSSGTQQGGSVDAEVQPLDEVNKAELEEGEAAVAQAHLQLSEELSSGVPQRGEIETNAQVEQKDDGEQGQGEGELPQEPVLDLQGSGVRQGEGAGGDMQAQGEAESLDTAEDQSSGADVELTAEGDELNPAPAESTQADLQPLGEAGSSGTQQGGSVDAEVHPLDQEDKEKFLEREAEDVQEDRTSHEGVSPGAPWGWEGERAVHLEEEEDGAQGQGERGLPREPVPHLQGSGVGHSAGAGEDVQAQGEAESLDTVEHQSSGADVELAAEGDELNPAPAESTQADLQPLSQTDSRGTEQGGNVAPDVHPLGREDKEELVEMEAEDCRMDSHLCVSASPETPQGGGHCAAVQPRDGAGGWGQGGRGLMQELVPHPSGVTIRQRRGTDASVQPVEEVEILDTVEDQSSGADVELTAEGDELDPAPAESTQADLQPLGEAGSSGTQQGGSVDAEVQPLDQEDKEKFLEREAEDVQAHLQLSEELSSGVPQRGEIETNAQVEQKDDGEQGQGEGELPQEPVLDLQGSGVRQGEGAGGDMQAQGEAESLDTAEDQSSGANVELTAEGDELRLTQEGSTQADLQPLGEAGSSGTQQGGSVDAEVRPLDEVNKAELEVAQEHLQLCGGLSPGAAWGGEWGRAVQDEEDGAQVQGENGLPQEPVLGPEGARGRQGEGAGAGVQPQEEAESLDTLEAQSTDADVQLFTDQQKPKSGSEGSTEADLTPLGVAGMWEGQQSLTLGLEAVLGANPREGAAAADVLTPGEADLGPGPVTAAEGPGLEAELGACIGPEGQILEAQESLQGERAPAEGKPLDGAHSLEVAQGERLEAGARNGVKTQGLGLNQGHDDAALASLVSEVPLQISPLRLETMMQEDVLIPDVWRLCAPGQAAQRELQEQVSAQGHEGRLHTVAQQPEGKMEPEHTAAEHPKREVPPASTLHATARPEDAGSDQLGMVLRDNSLGKRQLLGEQSKDLGVGQQEKTQEFGQKMSREGEPSPGEPGAVTAGGAGAAPRGCPKAPLDPDHVYNVLFIGDSHVGKTSFLYRLHTDTFNPHLAATVGLDYQIKTLVVDNKSFALRLWDSAGQERYRSMTRQFFRKADGVVLMYDITSEYSFSDVRYWLGCIQEAAEDGVAVLLLGNKTDCAAQRQVPTKEGECLAKEHQLMFYECSAASGHNVFESMVSFVRLLKVREDELKNKAGEVPKAPQKKKGCCW